MYIEQIKGPFSRNSSKTFGGTDGRVYKHIGIQIPHREPTGYSTYRTYRENKKEMPSHEYFPATDISITTTDVDGSLEHFFIINETGILELDGDNLGGMLKVKFFKDMPPETIIDLVYAAEGE